MKTWTAIALGAVAAVGTAAAIALWKRRQDEACCRYDSDEMDDDEFFCEDCGSCGVCDEEELDVEIPSDADEAVDAVKEAAEDAAEKAALLRLLHG